MDKKKVNISMAFKLRDFINEKTKSNFHLKTKYISTKAIVFDSSIAMDRLTVIISSDTMGVQLEKKNETLFETTIDLDNPDRVLNIKNLNQNDNEYTLREAINEVLGCEGWESIITMENKMNNNKKITATVTGQVFDYKIDIINDHYTISVKSNKEKRRGYLLNGPVDDIEVLSDNLEKMYGTMIKNEDRETVGEMVNLIGRLFS